jgi:acyl carrier protein
MNTEEINKTVMKEVAEMFGVKPEELSSETKLQEDLGADSIDQVDLIIAFENEYNVTFPDADIFSAKFDTIADIAKFIEEHLNK